MRGNGVDEINLLDAATEFTFQPDLGDVGDFPGRDAFRLKWSLCVRRHDDSPNSWVIRPRLSPQLSWDPKRREWVYGTRFLGPLDRAMLRLPEVMAIHVVEVVDRVRLRLAEETRGT